MHYTNNLFYAFIALALAFAFSGCKKEVEACFTFSKSQNNLFRFHFNSDCSEGAAAYDWDFGGGATSIAASPSHTFPGFGEFPVTLRVTSKDGRVNTVTEWVVLTEVCKSCVCVGGWFIDEICDHPEEIDLFCDWCVSFHESCICE